MRIEYALKEAVNMAKQRVNITLDADTKERLEQYAFENHLGSISAAITDLAWKAKVKNSQVRGQTMLPVDGGKK